MKKFKALLAGILLLASTSWAQTVTIASDITRHGVGARVLGMGGAYLGIADDMASIYLNPSGLSRIKTGEMGSTASKIIGEINYMNLSGVSPLGVGGFGVGMVLSGLQTQVASGLYFDENFQLVASYESVSSFNHALLFSYGLNLGKIFTNHDLLNRTSLGATFKYFSQGITRPGESNTGRGYELDVGGKYLLLPYLTLGASASNLLPSSLGGKITYTSGAASYLPLKLKAGAGIKALGKEGMIYSKDQQLTFAFDYEISPTIKDYPSLWHVGLEWFPLIYLALRAGIDQDVIGKGTSGGQATSNLTAGIGLAYQQFRFDYAYHQYAGEESTTTHFFSLSYSLAPREVEEEIKIKEAGERKKAGKEFISLITPSLDKLTTYEDYLLIEGEVPEDKVKTLWMNGTTFEVKTQTFEIKSPKLNLGKNLITLAAMDKSGKSLEVKKLKVLKLPSFLDVDPTFFAKDEIEWMAALGIVGGYKDKTFKPLKGITRAELAAILMRLKGEVKEVSADVFKDVKKNFWAAKYIKKAVEEGVFKGYPDGSFKPNKVLTRAEGIATIVRFAKIRIPVSISEGPFPTVPGRHWAAKEISAAKEAGLLKYLKDEPLYPDAPFTRAEAVKILSQTPEMESKIDDLLNFEAGY